MRKNALPEYMILTLRPEEISLTREPAFAFFKESGLDGELNFDHFCATWGNLIRLDMACIMLYLDAHQHPSGIIGGTLTPCTMTADLIAMESFWWIAPELRGKSMAGIQLLRKWENWAVNGGAKRIYVGNLWSLNNSEMQELYRKLGYRPLEVHYVK